MRSATLVQNTRCDGPGQGHRASIWKDADLAAAVRSSSATSSDATRSDVRVAARGMPDR
jgi:hypothetical protein